MRIATVVPLVVGALAACVDVTEIPPDRVPPPERRRVGEGALDQSTDPCGALDVGPPVRLSASPGDSDGVRMARLSRPGAEAWVGVVWIEHGTRDTPAQIAFQLLLEDGVPLGDTEWIDAADPESVEIVAAPGTDSFAVVTEDRALSQLATACPLQGGFTPVTALALLDRPQVVLGLDRALVVGLDYGEGPRSVHLADLAIEVRPEGRCVAQDTELVSTFYEMTEIQATDVTIASDGVQSWLAWVDAEGSVCGALLTKDSQDQWETPTCGDDRLAGHSGFLRRVQGTQQLALAYIAGGSVLLKRLEAQGWTEMGSGRADDEPNQSLAGTRGEGGTRWAVARTFAPDGGSREVRIERARPHRTFCENPGECQRVTADLQESSAPEIVGVNSGYLVAWTDRLPDGQTEVFVASARCHPMTVTPD